MYFHGYAFAFHEFQGYNMAWGRNEGLLGVPNENCGCK